MRDAFPPLTKPAAVHHSLGDSSTWPSRRFRPRLLLACSYLVLLAGLLTIGVTAYMVTISYSGLPYVDGWAEIDRVSGSADLSFPAWLWEQHNEHRLVIPKLFLEVDLRLFRATQVFLLASIFVVQLLHLALLGWCMRVLGGWRSDLWRTGLGVAAFCLFCPCQWFNFVLGFQINFMLLGLFVTLSFAGLLLYWIRSQEPCGGAHSIGYLLLSILAALAATYTLANGNLLWPLLVAAALLLRLRRAALIGLIVTGAISTALYFRDYASPTAQANAMSLPAAPARFFKFVAVYLGSPWVHANLIAAAVLGVAGAGAACLLVLRFRSYARTGRAFSLQMVLTSLFCLGTSFVTALGRLNFGASYALSPRYQTFAMLFWLCLALILLGSTLADKPGRGRLLMVQICLLAVMLRGAWLARYPIREARLHGFQLNAASMALLTGVPDGEQLSSIGVKLEYLMSQVPYLQERRLSVFSGPLPTLLGQPLESAFRLAAADECAGQVESTMIIGNATTTGAAMGDEAAMAGGAVITGEAATMGPGASAGEAATQPRDLRITGWAWDYKHGGPPAQIVAATNGVISGLGAVGDWRPAGRKERPQVTSNYTGFTVYVRDVGQSTPVNLYAIQGNPPSACLFATAK